MKIIDYDLLSLQEARILIEDAVIARDSLKEFKDEQIESLKETIKAYMKANLKNLTHLAYEESCYGNENDEYLITDFYIENIDNELTNFPRVFDVINSENTNEVFVALPKGITLSYIAPSLSVLTTFQIIYLALHTRNPVIFVANKKVKNTIIKMVEDIAEICYENLYIRNVVSILKINSELSNETLVESEEISLIIENILSDEKLKINNKNADHFLAEMGNNIVFIDKSADLKKVSNEIIRSKSFNNGLLPGVEQAIVVDSEVYDEAKNYFINNGAYFLTKDEHIKLQKIIYDENLKIRRELIGRSAKELLDMAKIKTNEDIKVLVVTKPYVSINSPYSKEKYHPILSMYIEDDWLNACEKCVELILNDEKGQSLSIYSNDSYVIEQFIEKKPVARVLVNTSTGFGTVGLTSNLPLSFIVTSRQITGQKSTSLNPNHFIRYKQIAMENGNRSNNFDDFIKKLDKESSLFKQVIKNIKDS
ncbi:aldehyde dehydrogenase family protein [Peptoniphilus sp. MSJ-1]|uniref:Aldehyde dehydrogenase family protein n=1 Tax=Peptoniphilus ovalis TaxID=2841503 RepID=A0ABS6FFQ4_9FIRM|nr:aldehyde dehydrogenase family protein [Peptoniphilus ovalis]MBU5668824.1 aldehyde dehydrogenase family protein [Peptoniphilus ovalis]